MMSQWTRKTAITEAINAIVEKRVAGEKVGFKHVLKVLRDSTSSEIASVGRYLTSIVTNSILELAFSDGTTQGLNYESRVTILEVNNLKLPKTIPQKFQIMNATLLLSCLRLVPSVPTLENEMKMKIPLSSLMKHGFL